MIASKESYFVSNYTVKHKGLVPLCEGNVVLPENNARIKHLYCNGGQLIYS